MRQNAGRDNGRAKWPSRTGTGPLVHRHGRASFPDRAGVLCAQQRRRERGDQNFELGDVDDLAPRIVAVSDRAFDQRGDDGAIRQRAGLVGCLIAAAFQRRSTLHAVDAGPAGTRIGGELVAWRIGQCPGQTARRDRADDGFGVVRHEFARVVGRHDHIRLRGQLAMFGERSRSLVGQKVPCRRALAVGVEGRMVAQFMSARRLDHHHVGTVVGQQTRTPRGGGAFAAVQYAQSLQGGLVVGWRHVNGTRRKSPIVRVQLAN